MSPAETFPPSVITARRTAIELHGLGVKTFWALYRPTVDFTLQAYTAYCELETAGKLDEFCRAHRIVAHGNVENKKFQPFVKFLFGKLKGDHVRQVVWRGSTAIASAQRAGINPDGFIAWLKENGGLYGVVTNYKKSNAKPKLSAAELEELAQSVLVKDAPVSPATPVTYIDRVGRTLFAGDLDSSGKFIVQAVLPHSHREVTRILVDVALGKFDKPMSKNGADHGH